MDNLTVHKTRVVVEFMDENEISYIYNVPYSPDYNPIESVFSKVKKYYGMRKLNAFANERMFERNKEIRIAFS